MTRTAVACAAALVTVTLSAVAPVGLIAQIRNGAEIGVPTTGPSYRLTLGDVLDVKFPYHSAFNATVTVRPDGYISLILIGDVHAEGRTPLELAALINDRYGSVVRNADAAVIVREFTPQRAFIGGEVVAPGAVDLHGRITALQAILKSGGLKTSAKTDGVLLTRYSDDNTAELHKLNLKRVLEGRQADEV